MGIRETNRLLKDAANDRYDAAAREVAKLDARLLRFERTLCNRLFRAIMEGGTAQIADEVGGAIDDVTVMIGRTMERIIGQTQRQAVADAREIVPEECYDDEVEARARRRGEAALRIARKVRSRLPADNRPALGAALRKSQRELLPELLTLEEKQRIVLQRLLDDERFRIITTSFVEGQRRTWDRRVTMIAQRLAPRDFGRTLAAMVADERPRREIKDMACEFARRLVNQARVIGRTESFRVYRLTDDAIFGRFQACLSAYQRFSVGDERVRPSHVRLHGRIFRKQSDGEFRDTRGNLMSVPPDAPNCRCWLVPIFSRSRATESAYEYRETIDRIPEYSRHYQAEGAARCGCSV